MEQRQNQKPISILVAETKTNLTQAISQIVQESKLPPSVICTILGEVRGEMLDGVLFEMSTVFNDAYGKLETLAKMAEEKAEE